LGEVRERKEGGDRGPLKGTCTFDVDDGFDRVAPRF
jgi:hypothetical protein